MNCDVTRPGQVVHLELHTSDRIAGVAFCVQLLCWQPSLVEVGSASYLALELGRGLGGGIVECGTPRPGWLPYVEVDDVAVQTKRARQLGAQVLLEPREGPA